MKKEDLFKKLKENTFEQYPMPEIKLNAITYDDKISQFISISQAVGGSVKRIKSTDNLNEAVKSAYPNAKKIASNMPEITIAEINPNNVEEANDLNGTDVGVLKGEWGVAENGCIWVPQTMKEKAICFISEYLVIVLEANKLLNNMHEGYKKIQVPEYGYGCWISGPSKTADIEQSLVMGAQAAKGITVILIEE